MPSLTDSLANLSIQSESISQLASLNSRPAGPYTQAYLYLPDSLAAGHGVTGLIRDAQEPEVRLFKFIGETDVTGAGGEKRVEKREGIVTPLKRLKRDQGDRGDVEVILRTALKLVDDYRPMPRARAHIANLLETHQKQQDRILQLESQIQHLNNPSIKPSPPLKPKISLSPSSKITPSSPNVKLTPDEAIKAEEESLKTLESSLQILRRQTIQNTSPHSSKINTVSPQSTRKQISPRSEKKSTSPQMSKMKSISTPAKTPLPNITNSLVNGTTPHRHLGTINRFSPLKLLGTPRAGVGPSGLGVNEDKSIFGKRLSRSVIKIRPVSLDLPLQPPSIDIHEETQNDEDGEEGDVTIRLSSSTNLLKSPIVAGDTTPKKDQTSDKAQDGLLDVKDATPRKEVTPTKKITPRRSDISSSSIRSPMGTRVEGVNVTLENVRIAVTKIWETLAELMRTGRDNPSHTIPDTVKRHGTWDAP
ncbi:hypothetical protein TREMEDRAFT_63457 [Tremella mesenterica DSM 1558]|uniref:uncharacterized protein n=1 Tax=Tremella mesenterica (strain ATCC 24925 / CBS 8224 / DSM 1558 / NBRC 9311 / NRRL Y-6157 / RJB 2259-6 / UBC 559-6) TaxID=578456 RepID=UPI0003F4A018|nr:uncharacterized protein TREMEDRAFT_63457 [Tremella mesenterica DSM 1558]EIW68285.1 hypothetical protein TREMEDRAFT_63457 [Tremella mesenterica DSM 1558]